MTRTRRRMTLCALWIGLNLVFIWGNSLLPGEISGAISDWVKKLIAFLLPGGVPGGSGGGLIRKLAHFLEFCSLGLALTWLLGMLKKPAVLALLGGFAAACLDETIQLFVPGRFGCLRDVCIDTAGVLLGLALLTAGRLLKNRKHYARRGV